ncbi:MULTISPECIES: glycosyltransferase family 2 protein [unclassified Cyanobium]|uniref:glycosyltransferase family 2 protein n=1 Tax=unclassified Cyanobium TaxID=2627006 RepID=UPI0020CF824A|nr:MULTISPECIES: glycosyltransferase family 2 protein [unclassified Cyanobium]MCP9860317.1 glycosyltransferase family 2 protein [Cyanobium sp. Cruz-8H5]MCP9867584.1 glycosyltransferase family 2 protein [Cyanobium sp. Cruz-8D1]
MTPPLVTAVVPTRNRCELSLRFLARMAAQTYPALRIVVVDANSSDGTVAAIRQQHPHVTVLEAGDRDFWAGATNRGVRQALAAGTDYVLTINDDAVVSADYVARMVALAQQHGCAILGNQINLLGEQDRIWSLGTVTVWGSSDFLRLAHTGQRQQDLELEVATAEVLPVDALPGNGVLIQAEAFRRIGLYDALFLPHYHADSEWVMRAVRRGIKAWVTPRVILLNDFTPAQKQLPLESLGGLIYALGHRRSHLYLLPVLTIFWRYCPRRQKWRTLRALASRFLRMRS